MHTLYTSAKIVPKFKRNDMPFHLKRVFFKGRGGGDYIYRRTIENFKKTGAVPTELEIFAEPK